MLKERNYQRFEKIGKKVESFSKRSDEKMENFMHSFMSSVGLHIRGTNSTTEKVKDEGDDRYNEIDERITTMERKLSR